MSQNDTQSFDDFLRDHVKVAHIGAPTGPRSLSVIAAEIRADWSNQGRGVSPYAEDQLSAMAELDKITDQFYADSAASVVRYFLANAGTWRGETARRIKAELNAMVKGVY